jgi:hypothetical protein
LIIFNGVDQDARKDRRKEDDAEPGEDVTRGRDRM